MRRRTVILVTVLVALAAPAAAHADTKTLRDPRDGGGRLDIRSVSHGHAGSSVVHTLVTYGTWSPSVLSGGNAAAFVFDTNDNWRDRPERFVVVFWERGRLRAALIHKTGRFLRWVPVSRPNGRTLRVTVPTKALNTKGYRWFAVTFDGRADDVAPNRGTPLHDFTPPTAKLTVPMPQTTTASLSLAVADSGYSKLKSWRLEKRPFGGGAWSPVASGTGPATRTVSLAGAEGQSYDLRLVAVDGQGNRTTAEQVLSFPHDDTHPSITYEGMWKQYANPNAYLGTASWAGPGDRFTYTFTGSYVAIVGPEFCAWGQVSIDGQPAGSLAQRCDFRDRVVLYSRTLPPGEHTLTFDVAGGEFGLDGMISR